MKRIVPNQPFLDGADRYEKDETYSVEDAKAFYFCQRLKLLPHNLCAA